jgi:hypothetical protein
LIDELKEIGYVVIKDWVKSIEPNFIFDYKKTYSTTHEKSIGDSWFEIVHDIDLGKPPYSNFNNGVIDIVSEIYDMKDLFAMTRIQFYDNGAYIVPHTDDNEGDIVAFQIYLNDKTSKGGELVIKGRNSNKKVTYEPSFGDLVILDEKFGKSNIHSVTPTYWKRFVMAGYIKQREK